MRRIAILAEANFNWVLAKTAMDIIRYSADRVVAVIDSEHAGQDVAQALGDLYGFGRGIPVVSSVTESLAYQPNTLVIGIAPIGGKLSQTWRADILQAIQSGLDVVNGLHVFLSDDPELAEAARKNAVKIWDVQRPSERIASRIFQGLPHHAGSHTVYFAGSDCQVGKMTAAIEVDREAQRRGLSSAMMATSQTGIIITGRGIPADRLEIGHLTGKVEAIVVEFTQQYSWVFVEGQGALGHPAYSAVTLGLLHGAAPDMLVLCHAEGRKHIDGYDVPIPPLSEVRRMYEKVGSFYKPAPVVCVALNTLGMSEESARKAIAESAEETNLPTTDPVRFGAGPLLDALLARA